MISREEILESASEKGLIADVVDKDYGFVWLLMGGGGIGAGLHWFRRGE